VSDRDPLTAPIRSCHEVGRILGISKNALEQDFAERKDRDERAELNEG
jgi:hypothetical protein